MDAIIYTSNTGRTKAYAEMLGKKLDLPVYALQEKKSPNGSIIYMGWIMAGKVEGYQKAVKRYRVQAVIGVGMGKSGAQDDEIRRGNHVPYDIPTFTLQGGFDLNALHGIYHFMMSFMARTVGKKLAEKTNRTADEDDMLLMMREGGNRVAEENLAAVLEWYGKEKR